MALDMICKNFIIVKMKLHSWSSWTFQYIQLKSYQMVSYYLIYVYHLTISTDYIEWPHHRYKHTMMDSGLMFGIHALYWMVKLCV